MSREQANTYRKFREAEDAQGNLGWAARMAKNALKQAAEAPSDIETSFGFAENERVLWRLMKIPRRYNDIENCGLLPVEAIRGYLRGLVAADVLDMQPLDTGKALLPLEVTRAKRQLAGMDSTGPVRKKAITERVFRPDIGLTPSMEGAAAEPAGETPAPVPEVTAPKKKVLSAKDWDLKKNIDEAFEKMKEQNHYEFLGVKQDAPLDAIRKAATNLAREYHPDVLAGSELEHEDAVTGKLDALFKRLNTSKRALTTPENRAEYDSTIGTVTRTSAGKVRRPQEAMIAHQKAETFFRRKDYKPAEKQYRLAVEFDPEDPKLMTALGWCVYLNEAHEKAKRKETAYKLLTDAVAKKYGDASYKLGLIARNDGDEKEAHKRFKECLRNDPKHVDAIREERLFERRKVKQREEEADKKGGLGRFLKR